MPLVPLRPLLEATDQYKFAFGAFNVNAVTQAQAVIDIHSTFHSAAILQGADLANGFMGGRTDFINANLEDKKKGAKAIAEAVRKFADNTPISIVLHLDHGKDFDSCKAAIDNGYTSVMIDGSHLDFESNVELTREVVIYAHERGVSVEGELGILAGVEDSISFAKSTYTNPTKVVDFIKKTGVDCLAISYGTKHGAQKGDNVKLRKEIAIAAKECLVHEGIFGVLVSHGSSTVPQYLVDSINSKGGTLRDSHGIPINELKAVIPNGIGKINVDTDIRLAVTNNLRELFESRKELRNSESLKDVYRLLVEKSDQFDPRIFLAPLISTMITGVILNDDVASVMECMYRGVQEAVGQMIVHFGQAGSNYLVKPISLDEMAEFYRN